MTRRYRAAGIALAAVATLGVAAPSAVSGGKPTIERIPIEDAATLDRFLTQACGIDVFTSATGHAAARVFPDGSRTAEVFTINVTLTATSAHGTIRFKDVGADTTRITKDGNLLTSIMGQVPFEFRGVLKLYRNGPGDADDVVVHEPKASERSLDRACAILNPEA